MIVAAHASAHAHSANHSEQIEAGVDSVNRSAAVMVPVEGIEPTLCCQNRILSPARLPVPPHRRA
jgi:hypothetical protein